MKLHLYCVQRENGFGDIALAESRKLFKCDKDGPECCECPCLKITQNRRRDNDNFQFEKTHNE